MSTIEEQQTSTPIVSDIENAKKSDIESSAPPAPVVTEDEQLQRKTGEDTKPTAVVDVDNSVPVTNGSGSQTTTKKDEQPLVSNGSDSQTATKKDEQPLVLNGDDDNKQAAAIVESKEHKHTEFVNGNGNGDGEHLLKSPAKEEKTNGHSHSNQSDAAQTKRDIGHVNNEETSATTGEIKKKAKLVAAEEEGNDTAKEELSAA